MAICSEEGVDAMLTVVGILGDVFEDGAFPRGVDGQMEEEAPDWFDEDRATHLRALYDRLYHFLSRDSGFCGDLRRVVFGYHTLVYARNRLVDLENDALAFHPRFERLEKTAREALEYLRDVSPLLGGAIEEPNEGVHAMIGRLAAALDFYDGNAEPADGKAESEVQS